MVLCEIESEGGREGEKRQREEERGGGRGAPVGFRSFEKRRSGVALLPMTRRGEEEGGGKDLDHIPNFEEAKRGDYY